MKRSLIALTGAAALTVIMAADVFAAPVPTVVPSPGKWAGTRETTSCNTIPAIGMTEDSLPDDYDCTLPLTAATEFVDVKIANRRITYLSYDLVIQCHPSDTDTWTATMMRFVSRSGWGYTAAGAGTGTAIPANGVLRMTFPVEESFDYPAGTVRATFDFRGTKAKVSIFYDGTLTEPGFTNHCVSQMNRPSVIPLQKRI